MIKSIVKVRPERIYFSCNMCNRKINRPEIITERHNKNNQEIKNQLDGFV